MSAKETHTAGPWYAVSRVDSTGFLIRMTAEDLPVAIVPNNLRAPDAVAQIAQLIAAAPDMLAALLKTRDNIAGLSTSDDDVYAAMVRRLEDAISKATAEPVPA